MKKIIAFTLCILTVLSLCSCDITSLIKRPTSTPVSTGSAVTAATTGVVNEVPPITVEEPDFAGLDLSPYIQLDYKGIEFTSKYEIREITDAIIDSEMNDLLIYYGHYSLLTDRKTEAGDTIEMSYAGYMDGEQFSGGTSEKATILLDTENSGYIPGFADGLIGVTPGDTVDLNLTFPEGYTSDLSGKAVLFKVTVKGICKAELTDETASTLSSGKYTNVSDFRAYYKQYLEQLDRYNQFNDVYEAISDKLQEITVVKKYHEQQLQYYYEYYVNYLATTANQYGITYDEMLESYGYTEDTLRSLAEDLTKSKMIEYYILNTEKVDIDELYEEYLENIVASYNSQGYSYSAEQLESLFNSYYGEGYLLTKAKEEKVNDIVYSNAKITYEPQE